MSSVERGAIYSKTLRLFLYLQRACVMVVRVFTFYYTIPAFLFSRYFRKVSKS
jgi:hypothetical protein